MSEPIYPQGFDAEYELRKAAEREVREAMDIGAIRFAYEPPTPRTSAEWKNYLNGMILPVNPSELVILIKQILQDFYQREQEAQFWQQRAEFVEARMRYVSPIPVYSSPIYFTPSSPFPEPRLASPLANPCPTEEHKKKRIIKFEE
jgi:hypothetical protein